MVALLGTAIFLYPFPQNMGWRGKEWQRRI